MKNPTAFSFLSSDLHDAMIDTGSLAGAIEKLFRDDCGVTIPNEMLRRLHAQICTEMMYYYSFSQPINPFNFELDNIDEVLFVLNRNFRYMTVMSDVPENFPKTRFQSPGLDRVRLNRQVRVSDVREMMADEFATKYVCHAICNLINPNTPMVRKNQFDHNSRYYSSAYQNFNACSPKYAKRLSYQVMGQMVDGVRSSGQIPKQIPKIFGSAFNSAVNRMAVLDSILAKNPDAVFEIDMTIYCDLIGHFE